MSKKSKGPQGIKKDEPPVVKRTPVVSPGMTPMNIANQSWDNLLKKNGSKEI